jgi:peptidoglycan/xylan/chitin deacetylase (PgdA/CDA1 family)
MYHYISEVPAADKNNPYSYRPGLSVTPTIFAQQMDYFQALGYHTITLNQLFDALYYHGPLPDKPIIFSFDDGYVDAYTHAYPILKAHKFTGMFYIITGKVGWQGQATWPQLQEMLANGMRMGSHTIDHRALGDVWEASPADAQHELVQSQQTLENHLHTIIQQFCYPSGDPLNKNPTLAITQIEIQNIFQLLNATGYVGATNDPVINTDIQTSTDPFNLKRIRVQGSESIEQFKAEMAPFFE